MHSTRHIVGPAALFLVMGFLTDAQAAWRICNRTAENKLVAIAYVNPRGGGFLSEGWWELRPCGGCATVLQASTTSDPDNVFLRVEGPGGVIEGSSIFCVGKTPFTTFGKGRCADKRAFEHKQINIRGNFTTNIRGRSASGRVCID
jgi:uncharacterized membrane protein